MGENRQRGNTRNPDAGMCFFYDWIDQIKCIRSKAARYELIEAMIEFARSGKNPPEFRDAVSRAVAIGIFKQMERSKTYAENAKKRGNKGNSGTSDDTENSGFADSNADSNADSTAASIAASIADTQNNNYNNNYDNMSVCPSVSSNPADNDRQTDKEESETAIPTREEVREYFKMLNCTEQTADKYFEQNQNRFHWANVLSGTPWRENAAAWLEKERFPSDQTAGGEHSFNLDEFISLAEKRSFKDNG